MIKNSLFLVPLLLILLSTVVCQAQPLTERDIVALIQYVNFSNQSFSIKSGMHTFPGTWQDIADTNSYAELDSTVDDKRHSFNIYGLKTTIIESNFWRSLYANHLLIDYELFLTSKGPPLCTKPSSWLPVEVLVSVGWLLKSYWHLNSPSFNTIDQKEATSTERQGDNQFTTMAMTHGSGDDQLPYLSSKSSEQQVKRTTSQPTNCFTNLMYFGYGDGSRDPYQPLHTLGLNCFIFPCFGVCCFRPSPDIRGAAEWTMNSLENSAGNPTLSMSAEAACATVSAGSFNDDLIMHENLTLNADDSIVTNELLSLINHDLPEENGTSPPVCFTSGGITHYQQGLSNHKRKNNTELRNCVVNVVGKDRLTRPCGKVFKNAKSLSSHKSKYHSGQETCNVIMVGRDGRQWSCGTVCKSLRSLSTHKRRIHCGQQTCDVTVVGEDGLHQPCGTVCKNPNALSEHKSRKHSGQKKCSVTVAGEDGQLRECGKVCKDAEALTNHKTRNHTAQRICLETVVGEDGQLRTCGKVSKNARNQAYHKRREHSGRQICDATVVGENGLPRPCGKVCKNAGNLSVHKRGYHTGQKTCDVTVSGKDGQPQPCKLVCENSKALADHRRRTHTGKKTCDVTVVGEDGQLRPCGKVFKNTGTLSYHKRREHTGQQICCMTLVGEDGRPRPCGKICKNAQTLYYHKIKDHTTQQTCDLTVVGKDGQPRPCGKICKNAPAMTYHRIMHRKRKPVNKDRNSDLNP
ncbi:MULTISPECIES: hypothetical protein [unclassified Endozoicomonas]|uniref:hypothetical protein n=1 Tax=unclassified Endozoicomonas TaxID=2644528 RepID=UPI0021479FDF|nr:MULTISPECIES: hypothetical protein [unclassified Endozoicomonas]